VFKAYGLIGLILVSMSFVLTFFDLTNFPILNVFTLTAFFTTGFWLFTDALDYHLSGSSILHRIMQKRKLLFWLIMVGIFIGLLFDFFGILISRLWQWYFIGTPAIIATFRYIVGLVWGYGVPILMYYSFYRVIMHLVKKEFPHHFGLKIVSKTKNMFRILLVLGVIFLLIPLTIYPFVRVKNEFFGFFTFTIALVGIWFILEYIEHKRKQQTFLEDIITGHWRPVLGLIIAAVLTALLWEGLNTISPKWTYTNLILQDIKIIGIPIQVILGWIPLYIIYLSFYRAVVKGKDKVWRE